MIVKQELKGHQSDADADGGIRDIERRPMKRRDIKIKEVHHFTITQPIDQVSDGAAQDQGIGEREVLITVS